jgi:hypothetical protein
MSRPRSIRLRVKAAVVALIVLSACSASTKSPNQSVTTSTVDPYISITGEVEQFVRSYVDQAVLARPELISKVSQPDLISCATSAVQQIARGTAMGIKQTPEEDTSDWYSRSRSAALQTAQSSIEGVIASCTR